MFLGLLGFGHICKENNEKIVTEKWWVLYNHEESQAYTLSERPKFCCEIVFCLVLDPLWLPGLSSFSTTVLLLMSSDLILLRFLFFRCANITFNRTPLWSVP